MTEATLRPSALAETSAVESQRTILEAPWFVRVARSGIIPDPEKKRARALPAPSPSLQTQTRWTLFLTALLVAVSFSVALDFWVRLHRPAEELSDSAEEIAPTPRH